MPYLGCGWAEQSSEPLTNSTIRYNWSNPYTVMSGDEHVILGKDDNDSPSVPSSNGN
jgi:hypothetical protein